MALNPVLSRVVAELADVPVVGGSVRQAADRIGRHHLSASLSEGRARWRVHLAPEVKDVTIHHVLDGIEVAVHPAGLAEDRPLDAIREKRGTMTQPLCPLSRPENRHGESVAINQFLLAPLTNEPRVEHLR